ncbi:hypothetical protein [Wolinella succinogenes]|uniref:Uncharacterized protein n=1 Tax=Wolinella succinogenes (strain ATCC 29543 / DSM 1740 / CCUG 13145 / JCM 31913 / LMG 7466 / NCTC 11488 / FDC 602W) TaxID=273121 RepID=Q7MQY8_WOLSU|nr:hypothetical protein [Wolinella succinogenes]NLU34985.1 hypothetical protein [Wolinella succinogenes]CAE10899.1 hypothetical protein WS1889 [Wolinella succinogenes]VEG81058.1 Uncharacterised protein [Wolinella succinogenes]HCZ18449.1 hypothetical protein [Helicobacter sp.]
MTFLERWIEHDYNPFVLFDSAGHVKMANQEGQKVITKIPPKAIFDLAVDYASKTPGFCTHLMEIDLGRFRFFGMSIGYESDEEIGIRLYREAHKSIPLAQGAQKKLVNIYVLIDLILSSISAKTKAKFSREFDPSVPDFYVDVDGFLKVVRKGYEMLLFSSRITTKVSVAVGEFVVVNEARYPILRLELSGEDFRPDKEALEFIKRSAVAGIEVREKGLVFSLSMAFSG